MPRCRSSCTFNAHSLESISWIFHHLFGCWSVTAVAVTAGACFALAGLLTLAYHHHHRRTARELRRRSAAAAIHTARRQSKRQKKTTKARSSDVEDPLVTEPSRPFHLLSLKQQQIAAEQIQRLYQMALAAWTQTQRWQQGRRKPSTPTLEAPPKAPTEPALPQAGSGVAEAGPAPPHSLRPAHPRRRRTKHRRALAAATTAAPAAHHATDRGPPSAEYSTDEPTSVRRPFDEDMLALVHLTIHPTTQDDGEVFRAVTVRVHAAGLGVAATAVGRGETERLQNSAHTTADEADATHTLRTYSTPRPPLPRLSPTPATAVVAVAAAAAPDPGITIRRPRRIRVEDRQMVLRQPAAQSAAEQQCHLLLQELNASATAWVRHLAGRYRPKNATHQRIEEWSGRRVVSFGSLRLGAWTTASDVDALVLGPPWLPRHVFFGRSYDQDGFVPFFMRSLKQRHHILSSVVYLPDAHVPVIRLRYANLDVDLLYCQTPFLDPATTAVCPVPRSSPEPVVPTSLSPVPTALSPLSRWGGEQKPGADGAEASASSSAAAAAAAAAPVGGTELMPSLAVVDAWLPFLSVKDALSLSGWRCTETVLHLVSQLGTGSAPCVDAFRRVLVGVKEWARKWGVYGQNFGYLGGVSWALLVLYTMQQTPPSQRTDVVCVFRTFLETFRTWPWEKRAVDVLLPLDGSPGTPTTSGEGCAPAPTAASNCMTIQTPLDARDTINAAFLVNRHTLAVIRRAFELTATEALARNLTPSLTPASPTRLTRLMAGATETASPSSPTRGSTAALHGSIHLLLAASDSGRLHTWTGWVESRVRHLQQWLLQQDFVESAAPWPTWWPMPPVPIDVETRRAREYWPRNDLAVTLVVRTTTTTTTGHTSDSVRAAVEQFLSTFSQGLCQKQAFAAFQFERMFLSCHFVLATDPS
jgi:hypothetical protein